MPGTVLKLGSIPAGGGVRFAVWSSIASTVAVRIFADETTALYTTPLVGRGEGIFEGELPLGAGALYKFVLDGKEAGDPYARFLPFGVLGPARVEAPQEPASRIGFVIPARSQLVIYELHLGTFSEEGTWAGATRHLPYLCSLGVNAIELMPVSSFAGKRGWGYDGVALFAPHAAYGEPEDMRAFIAAAHAHGLAVILDVVYNHFGPSGNYLGMYSPEYFYSRATTPWGDAPAFREPYLRRLVLDSARYWMEEIGFDGFRLDATHAIHDPLPNHVLGEIAALAKSLTPPRLLIAEDERNDPDLITAQGLDAIWTDDFHHVIHTMVTGERDGYYRGYEPRARELAKTIERGWLYSGEHFAPWGRAARGKPAEHLDASRFVYYIQNHDQIGNRAFGARLGSAIGADAQCACAMLLLFLPMIPLIFMGEEWAASTPFLYFTDHAPKLGEAIARGRRREFAGFEMFANPKAAARIPHPQAVSTFEASRLHWDELDHPEHAHVLALYRRMLHLRRTDPVLGNQEREGLTCATRGELLIVTRSRGNEHRTLLFNCSEIPVRLTDEYAEGKSLLASGPVADPGTLAPRAALLLTR